MFAANKFHDYIFGKKVTVESDHKPLETIFKKKLMDVPKRLQRMFLRLQKFNLKVKYKRGKEMYVADTLSRAYIEEVNSCSLSDEFERVDHRAQLPVTDQACKKLTETVSPRSQCSNTPYLVGHGQRLC